MPSPEASCSPTVAVTCGPRRPVPAPGAGHAHHDARRLEPRDVAAGARRPRAGVQRSGWKISPASTIALSHAHVSAARWTGSSSDSRRSRFASPAYSRRAWPSGQVLSLAVRRQARPCTWPGTRTALPRRLRFSARLKWTRPTRFQAGLKRLSSSCTGARERDSSAWKATPISFHRASSTAGSDTPHRSSGAGRRPGPEAPPRAAPGGSPVRGPRRRPASCTRR